MSKDFDQVPPNGLPLKYPPILPIDEQAMITARQRQNELTKPAGALGRLESLSIQLAGITRQARPSFPRKGVIIMAGDHGVAEAGVSAFPADVTPQMVINFLDGGAAVNVLARQAGATITIVDVGVNAELPTHPQLVQAKVAYGTQNLAKKPAMTQAEVEAAIQVGLDVIAAEYDRGLDIVALGEMGIGNTTPAAAITAAVTGRPVSEMTGRGTGVDDDRLQHKIKMIETALERHQLESTNPLEILRKVGGLEIAGLVGVTLGAAARHLPVVMDGFIVSAAALIAAEIDPAVKPYLIGGHASVEPGHQAILARLEVEPLLNLDLRLGEGTGAVLAFHLVEAAARTLNEMATFAEAAVSGKER
ncbi:MAG: nicotinate-nucleotide--dimethylbenzimidazole phosphoribosyltransferase [Ardenticatenaceae bacterium]|nr:nicotinate-nucleotide--dimethylbenzimidazole phosphoribosyltransferase [Ardenticatenaceae bacterium]